MNVPDERRDRTIPPAEPGPVGRLARDVPFLSALQTRLTRARSRVGALDALLDAVAEESDVGGGILAGALAYRLFLFFLPLAFFLVAVLGFVADALGSTPRTIGKEIGLVGLVTTEVADAAEGSSGVWVALGSLVALVYGVRVLYRAVAIVHALAWEHSAASAKTSLRSLRLFALGLVVQLALSVAVGVVRVRTTVGGIAALCILAAAMTLVWLVMSLKLPHGSASWTDLIPGSLLYGVGIAAVNAFNAYLLDNIHQSRASTYGTLGTAAAILLSLYFIGRIIVSAAVLNATLFARKARLDT